MTSEAPSGDTCMSATVCADSELQKAMRDAVRNEVAPKHQECPPACTDPLGLESHSVRHYLEILGI